MPTLNLLLLLQKRNENSSITSSDRLLLMMRFIQLESVLSGIVWEITANWKAIGENHLFWFYVIKFIQSYRDNLIRIITVKATCSE